MFESGPNYSKLKTNLRLAVNRLKLLEKKKTELALKARKEIADYITAGKVERAKIRVEQIIREDYLVEAMEVLEMYCDLLLARFGLVQQMKVLDPGLAEAISSIIWVAPRLQADVAELKIIGDQLVYKYGKPYGQACRDNTVGTVSEKLMHKLSVQAPPKILVEKYLIEIAKNFNVPYEPDPQVMRESAEEALIDLGVDARNDLGAVGGPGWANPLPQPPGFAGYPGQPLPGYPGPPQGGAYAYGPAPVNPPSNMGDANSAKAAEAGYFVPLPGSYGPPPSGGGSGYGISSQSGGGNGFGAPPPYNIGPDFQDSNSNLDVSVNGDSPTANKNQAPNPNLQNHDVPKPTPRTKFTPPRPDANNTDDFLDLPDLPSVPMDSFPAGVGGAAAGRKEDDIDFDDLTRRFEELKKKK
nr:EOG090X0DNH [Lepidurus arcticus]